MFEAHAKRQAVERMHLIKNAIVSGLWGNSNYDDENNTREKALSEIDTNFEQAMAAVYEGADKEIDKDDPFFGAMKVPEIDQRLTEEQIKELERRAQGQ